jgi:nitrite reductase (NADH) large subunit
LLLAGRFMQYYREHAMWLARTSRYMERVGLDEGRAVVVDDRDGEAARLDAAIQAAVDAYHDPWLEADVPATPSQFSSVVGASS